MGNLLIAYSWYHANDHALVSAVYARSILRCTS